jgi:hypothetical protein
MRLLKDSVANEEDQLNLEKAQLLHCISIAQMRMKKIDDGIVRKKAECDAFDRAIEGMSTAFDAIVETTDELLHVAHELDVGRDLQMSDDSDDDGQGEGGRRPGGGFVGPVVIGQRVTRWDQETHIVN